MPKLEDYGRISAKERRWFAENYADNRAGVHWRARETFSKAALLWAETSTAGEEGRRKFKAAAGENVLRLTPNDLDGDRRPTDKLGLVAAVRFLSTVAGAAHVRPPRDRQDAWIIATDPRSIYRGKLIVLGEHDDGAVYGLRLHDVLDSRPLIAAAQREIGFDTKTGQPASIDDLIRLRYEQREAIFAPFTPKEPREQALARVEVQRLVEEDDRTLGTLWLELGPRIIDRDKGRDELDVERMNAVRSQLRNGQVPEVPKAEEPATDPAEQLAPPAPPPKAKLSEYEESKLRWREIEAGMKDASRRVTELAAQRWGMTFEEAERELARQVREAEQAEKNGGATKNGGAP
jgi:hypothetical protein